MFGFFFVCFGNTQISGEILIFTNSDTFFLAGICLARRTADSFAIFVIRIFCVVWLRCCLFFVVMGILLKFISSLALVVGTVVVVAPVGDGDSRANQTI